MAYNAQNHRKAVERVVTLYRSVKEKEYDVPDTYIVRHVLPKHGIYISYRTLMNYKAMKLAATPQMQLF